MPNPHVAVIPDGGLIFATCRIGITEIKPHVVVVGCAVDLWNTDLNVRCATRYPDLDFVGQHRGPISRIDKSDIGSIGFECGVVDLCGIEHNENWKIQQILVLTTINKRQFHARLPGFVEPQIGIDKRRRRSQAPNSVQEASNTHKRRISKKIEKDNFRISGRFVFTKGVSIATFKVLSISLARFKPDSVRQRISVRDVGKRIVIVFVVDEPETVDGFGYIGIVYIDSL